MSSFNLDVVTGAFMCPSRENGTKIEANPIEYFTANSLEGNMSHYSTPGEASAQEDTSPYCYSDRGSFRNTPHGRFGSISQSKSRSRSQASTFSRAYTATLSKLGLRHGTKDNKLEDKHISALSGGMSVRIRRAIKRKPLLDFQPPHCQQKRFDDGLVVHMIGGMTPPSIIRSNQMKEGTSSEASVSSVNESPPHKIGINIRPDSFFGPAMHWNPGNGCSSRGDQASIRSVLNSADGDTSPSSVQKDSKRSVISLGPQLQRTLIPCLSLIPTDIFDTSLDLNFPVISSTPPLRFSLESPVLGTSAFAGDGPYISPVLSPLTPALKPTTTPVDSFIDIPSPTQVSGASEQQAITAVDISIETDENLSADTGMQLKDLSSDMEMIAMVSMDSLSVIKYRESLEHRGSRWDDLDQTTGASSFNIQSSIELTQLVASISSTSLLAPLTQADFDASFEQIFRVSYSGGLDPVLAATTHLGRHMALRKMHGGISGISVGNEHNSRTGGDGSRVYPYRIPELRIVPPSSP